MRWSHGWQRWSNDCRCRTTAALGVPQESISALSAAAQDVKRLMNNAPCSVSREIAAIYQTLYPEHA